MNERDFIYWLQGFLELTEDTTISERQVQIIKDHIALVLTKVTPDYDLKDFDPNKFNPFPFDPTKTTCTTFTTCGLDTHSPEDEQSTTVSETFKTTFLLNGKTSYC